MTGRVTIESVLLTVMAAGVVSPSAVSGQHPVPGWELSAPFPAVQLDITAIEYPNFFSLHMMQWQQVEAESGGLVDVSGYVTRTGDAPIAVVARSTIFNRESRSATLSLEFTGELALFINKTRFDHAAAPSGNPAGRTVENVERSGRFEVMFDRGLTEILIVLKSTADPWRFAMRADRIFDDYPKDHARLLPVWETPAEFRVPESVLYDPDRELLYVSSYDRTQAARAGMGFISKVSPEGEILDLHWVDGLDGPCGMGLHSDRLYAVECVGNLVEIDTGTGSIVNRYPAPGARFLNDLVIDADGSIYISDTSPPLGYTSQIYRFRDGEFEVWKEGIEIHRANGLFIHDGELLVGSSGDCLFKAIDLGTKAVRDIVALGGRVIDGIRVDRDGNYLVTLWEGEAVLISPGGDLVEILDIRGSGRNLADMEFIRDLDLLVVPTFLGNTVTAWRLVYP